MQQGDPLSRMLCTIVMAILNALINNASDIRLLQPLQSCGSSQQVSLYTDDVVLFKKKEVPRIYQDEHLVLRRYLSTIDYLVQF